MGLLLPILHYEQAEESSGQYKKTTLPYGSKIVASSYKK